MNKFWDHYKSKLLGTIITVVVLFLLNNWLESIKETYEKNTNAIVGLSEKFGYLGSAVDSLRWQMGTTNLQIVEKFGNHKETLNDHEDRIRTLEKK